MAANPTLTFPVTPAQVAPTVPDGAFVLAVSPDDQTPAWWPPGWVSHPNAPALLFGVGDPAVAGRPMVAMTGTRKPTRFGLAVAEATAHAASSAGAVLVCGGAAGCDEVTARTMVQFDGQVLVVAASGPETLSWPGVGPVTVVSRFPFGLGRDGGTGPLAEVPHTFPELRRRLLVRNTEIVHAGALTVVVAGEFRSGTSSAAWLAVRAGRPVVVAPPRSGEWPDAQLPHALAYPDPVSVAQLRSAGAPADVAKQVGGRRGPIASAVAKDREGLAVVVDTYLRLSPDTRAASSPAPAA